MTRSGRSTRPSVQSTTFLASLERWHGISLRQSKDVRALKPGQRGILLEIVSAAVMKLGFSTGWNGIKSSTWLRQPSYSGNHPDPPRHAVLASADMDGIARCRLRRLKPQARLNLLKDTQSCLKAIRMPVSQFWTVYVLRSHLDRNTAHPTYHGSFVAEIPWFREMAQCLGWTAAKW